MLFRETNSADGVATAEAVDYDIAPCITGMVTMLPVTVHCACHLDLSRVPLRPRHATAHTRSER